MISKIEFKKKTEMDSFRLNLWIDEYAEVLNFLHLYFKHAQCWNFNHVEVQVDQTEYYFPAINWKRRIGTIRR